MENKLDMSADEFLLFQIEGQNSNIEFSKMSIEKYDKWYQDTLSITWLECISLEKEHIVRCEEFLSELYQMYFK